MSAEHKCVSLVTYDAKDVEEEEKKQAKNEHKHTIKNGTELTDEETQLLLSELHILSDKTLQIDVLNALLLLYPTMRESFSTTSNSDNLSSYLLIMVKKGYDMICAKKYSQLHSTLARHLRYDISEKCMIKSLRTILEFILKLENENKNQLINDVWSKATNIIIDTIPIAFTIATRKNLTRNRTRIDRHMSAEDIQCVVSIWHELVSEKHKSKLSELLTKGITRNEEMYIIFQRLTINIESHSSVIISMLDAAINQLSNLDYLIPFLSRVGQKHAAMNIKPQLLAGMKKILMDCVREILTFNYTDDIKLAWNRVLAFIIGIMINFNDTPSLSTAPSKTIETIDISTLTTQVVKNCQLSWQQIENVIDRAVKIFYNNLCDSKPEIKQLFSKTNMVQQSQRLCKAIGSTVALLDEPNTLISILSELGKRHVYYGVKPNHFKYVKQCWFNMLKQALSLNWNEEINHSWTVAWSFITYHMKTALEDALLLYIPPDPIKINFKVIINHIDSININNSSFFGNIWFTAYTGRHKSQSYAFGNHNHNKRTDLPFVDINCLSSLQTINKYRNSNNNNIRYFEEDDSWFMRANIIGTYSNIFNLQNYPFDMHDISILFSLQVDDTIAMFNENELSVRLMSFIPMIGNNYNIYEPNINLIELSAVEGGSSSGKRYTHCKIIIPISRKYIYYVYNIILPLIIMQLITFVIYFIELFPITNKIIITLILLITLFVFKFNYLKLPPTPYLTFLDYWFNAAFILFMYHIIGLCVIYQLKYYYPQYNSSNINIIIGIIGIVAFVIINASFIGKAKHFISLYPKNKGEGALNIIAKHAIQGSNSFHH